MKLCGNGTVGSTKNLKQLFGILMKEAKSRGFCCLRSILCQNSLLSAFSHTQNAAVKLTGSFQMNSIKES